MPIVTFWSSNEKSIGQTVTASIAATVTAIEHNYKVLLISADYNDKIMEGCFGAQESNKEIVKGLIQKPQINLDSGIQGLLKLAESNRISPEIIHDYTKIIFKNRLEVLLPPRILEKEKQELFREKINNIILNASKYYDYVFIDLEKGFKGLHQTDILNTSDVIVFDIDQRIETVEEALNNEEIKKIYSKIVWNMCKADTKSKYNSKNITRKILKKEKINETEYNTLVLEASQEGNIPELMLRFRTIKEDDSNYIFISKVKSLIEQIIFKYRETRSRM